MGTWGVVRSLFLKLIERSTCGHVSALQGSSGEEEIEDPGERDDKWQSINLEEAWAIQARGMNNSGTWQKASFGEDKLLKGLFWWLSG